MNEYQFLINNRLVTPNYKDDILKEYELESGQIFFRTNLSGKLVLLRSDYDWLDSQPFDTKFILTVQRNKAGVWSDYFTGTFCKTDVKWNVDNRTCELKINVNDKYISILSDYEKEFNLIELAPGINNLTIVKRPVIQVYVLGSSIVTFLLGGTYWEQSAEKVITVDSQMADYHFSLNTELIEYEVTTAAELNGIYAGNATLGGKIYRKDGLYYILVSDYSNASIRKTSDDSIRSSIAGANLFTNNQGQVFHFLVGAVQCYVTAYKRNIYMRYLMDVTLYNGIATYDIPTDDILLDNLNYRKCLGYGVTGLATINLQTTTTPTKYGKNDTGEYFKEPYSIYSQKFYPISRNSWINTSIWFNFSLFDYQIEEYGKKDYILKDVFYLNDVIRVLLSKIAPGITHLGTSDYSEFFYGTTNPITNQSFRIMMTQKSNVLHGEYDKPAQKATITMRDVMNMLRDCFQCYWWIDNDKLRIEHISYFKNGGTYTGTPEYGFDLTQMLDSRNKKPLDYMFGNYEYDKLTMNQYYQFSWMDDKVSQAFIGYPIEIKSNYVEPNKNENINVSLFTTDIDFMLLNNSELSQDGFALFSAVNVGGVMKLPFIERTIDNAVLRLQNGYMSWITLQPNYWTSNLPAKNVNINNEQYPSYMLSGIERKKKQTVQFPSEDDPDPMKLIKTSLGDGQIEKISVNLSSRMNKITLRYDTE